MLRGEPGTQVCLLVWSGDVASECEADALVVPGVAATPAGRVDARGDPDRLDITTIMIVNTIIGRRKRRSTSTNVLELCLTCFIVV